MTSVAEQAVSEKEARDAALEARKVEIAAKEKEANAGRTGKGLRVYFGMTRGRNPQMIQYENWDFEQPNTLPTSLGEVIDIHKARKEEGDVAEKEMVRRWLVGDNEILYKEASDPVAEFVDSSWPEDVQKQFRLVVRNYASATKVSIEDAVALIKPGIVKSQEKKA